MVLLRGLAEAPDLQLRVLVGEDALDRPVDGVFTTDLLDPRRYLTGGEIVLTGLMWRRTPADSETFVAAVTAAGAVALAAGDAALGSVPDDLVAACQRYGLPLFEVPVDVSFAAITEQVLAARLRPAGPGPAQARLRALAAGRGRAEHGSVDGAAAGLAEVFTVASREYGAPGWVLSAAGRLVAGAPAAPDRRARAALAAAWLGAGAPPVTVLADGVPYSLFGVTGEPAHRLAGWFVAMAGDQAGWDTDRRSIAAELAAATAAHRARDQDARRAVRRAADAAMGLLADRPAGATAPEDREIAAALRRGGLAPGTPLVAVALTAWPAQPGSSPGTAEPTGADAQPGAVLPPGAAQPPGGTQPVRTAAAVHAQTWPQVARVLLEEMLPGCLAGVHGGQAVALAPGAAAVLDQIRDLTQALAGVYGPGAPRHMAPEWSPGGYPGDALGQSAADPMPASPCLSFGVSVLSGKPVQSGPPSGDSPATPGGGADACWTVAGIGRAVAQARQARRIAALLGGGVRVVDAAGLGSVELLLATAPAEARRAFSGSLLSPLLDYDAHHGTALVPSLRVFLDCSGSWTKAAEAMFVHVNSLRYRMRRVEELTGRDLGSLADQAALLLALRLSDPGLAEDHGADPGGGGGVEAGQFPAG